MMSGSRAGYKPLRGVLSDARGVEKHDETSRRKDRKCLQRRGVDGKQRPVNYAAAKAGLIAFTKSVAKELGGRGVQANVVAPGLIETDMTAVLSDDVREAMMEQVPLGRLGTPEDIARTIRFLVVQEARTSRGRCLWWTAGW